MNPHGSHRVGKCAGWAPNTTFSTLSLQKFDIFLFLCLLLFVLKMFGCVLDLLFLVHQEIRMLSKEFDVNWWGFGRPFPFFLCSLVLKFYSLGSFALQGAPLISWSLFPCRNDYLLDLRAHRLGHRNLSYWNQTLPWLWLDSLIMLPDHMHFSLLICNRFRTRWVNTEQIVPSYPDGMHHDLPLPRVLAILYPLIENTLTFLYQRIITLIVLVLKDLLMHP